MFGLHSATFLWLRTGVDVYDVTFDRWVHAPACRGTWRAAHSSRYDQPVAFRRYRCAAFMLAIMPFLLRSIMSNRRN